MTIRNKLTFGRFTQLTLWFNLLVILWGGYVSISGSGDGCGEAWPLCPNLLTASRPSLFETLVEFSHRATSGFALLMVIALFVWARRKFEANHLARIGARWALIFIVIESLLGAGLVLFRWVDTNISLARAVVQPIHLANTFLLMASIGLTAWWADGKSGLHWRENRPILPTLILTLAGIVLISSFGTIASLATTIFPSESFFEGVAKDFAREAHYLIRLRIWHPLIAVAVGAFILYIGRKLPQRYPDPQVGRVLDALTTIYLIQFAMGGLNAILLAPVWLQLAHLLGAHLLWLTGILLTATVLASPNASPISSTSTHHAPRTTPTM